jgi:hypothetical protein
MPPANIRNGFMRLVGLRRRWQLLNPKQPFALGAPPNAFSEQVTIALRALQRPLCPQTSQVALLGQSFGKLAHLDVANPSQDPPQPCSANQQVLKSLA